MTRVLNAPTIRSSPRPDVVERMASGTTQLRPLDIAFLCMDGRTTPMSMGAVTVFRPTRPIDPAGLVELLAKRAARIPSLRLRLRPNRFPPGGARWQSERDFDPRGHIHTYRPPPQDARRLLEVYASAWIAQPLDLSRPPWDLHVVTGLPDGEFALLLKLHHALTDGAGAVAVAAALLDGIDPTGPGTAQPRPTRTIGTRLEQVRQTAEIAADVLRAVRPPRPSPLTTTNSTRRRLGFARLDLADIRQIRRQHGGTINDVVLAALSGGVREWLISRGRAVDGVTLRALVPVSLRGRQASRLGGNDLSGYLCDLPVGEPDPIERLSLIRAAMDRNKAAGPARGAGAIPMLANRIPAALHRIGTRFAGLAAPLLFDTVVTNVPLPRVRLTLADAALREIYPLVPLAPGHALGVAVSTFHDNVHIGLQVDREAIADVDELVDAIVKSTATLHELCA
jgi:diacylglycerol O-acyltransferase